MWSFLFKLMTVSTVLFGVANFKFLVSGSIKEGDTNQYNSEFLFPFVIVIPLNIYTDMFTYTVMCISDSGCFFSLYIYYFLLV